MRRLILPSVALTALAALVAYRQARLARGEAALGLGSARRNGSAPEPTGAAQRRSG